MSKTSVGHFSCKTNITLFFDNFNLKTHENVENLMGKCQNQGLSPFFH